MKRAEHTQEQRILMLLQSSYPDWTPAPALARVSLQYSARIYSLRRRGWQIANRVRTVNGVKHGEFRLAQPLRYPSPAPRTDFQKVDKPVSGLLFGAITKEHDDRG